MRVEPRTRSVPLRGGPGEPGGPGPGRRPHQTWNLPAPPPRCPASGTPASECLLLEAPAHGCFVSGTRVTEPAPLLAKSRFWPGSALPRLLCASEPRCCRRTLGVSCKGGNAGKIPFSLLCRRLLASQTRFPTLLSLTHPPHMHTGHRVLDLLPGRAPPPARRHLQDPEARASATLQSQGSASGIPRPVLGHRGRELPPVEPAASNWGCSQVGERGLRWTECGRGSGLPPGLEPGVGSPGHGLWPLPLPRPFLPQERPLLPPASPFLSGSQRLRAGPGRCRQKASGDVDSPGVLAIGWDSAWAPGTGAPAARARSASIESGNEAPARCEWHFCSSRAQPMRLEKGRAKQLCPGSGLSARRVPGA